MADLQELLPDFDVKPYFRLMHSLRKNEITLIDIISLDPAEIARKCPLPLLDVRQLTAAVTEHMQGNLDMLPLKHSTSSELLASTSDNKTDDHPSLAKNSAMFVKTLDSEIDKLLGGGFPGGYITEVVGESSAGKTQFLIGLLLSAQLSPPHGLGKAAIYISTEDPLNTSRLHQMLESHPVYSSLPIDERPTLDHVHAMTVNTLEKQQHIAEFLLPRAVAEFDAGLIIIDSVAANFRADGESTTASGLKDRATDLTKLGGILGKLAAERNIAVVVANQVSDRFTESLFIPTQDLMRSSSPASSTATPSQSSSRTSERDMKMSLDHQSRFFTGWGDKPASVPQDLKAPALGLVWANQIDARVVMKVESQFSSSSTSDGKRRRFMNVVFAPWTETKMESVDYSIEAQGIVSRVRKAPAPAPMRLDKEHQELLEESLWSDGEGEFP